MTTNSAFDVVVIGGGLIGCATAYYLAKGGATVLMVEKGELNRQASGRNAGSLHFQLEHRLIDHANGALEQFARIMPLNLAAINDWANLESELGTDLEVTMDGGLMLAETADEVALLERKCSLEKRWGLSTQLLYGSEVQKKAPYLCDEIQAAAFCAQEGHANPRLVTIALAESAVRHGARILTHSRVGVLERTGREWRACIVRDAAAGRDEETHDVTGGTVVNAAGAWAGVVAENAGLHCPIRAVPLLMNATERREPFIPHLIQHVSRPLSVKQVRDGNILIGGGWPAHFEQRHGRPDLESRARIDDQSILENLQVAQRMVPGLASFHLLRCWTGIVGVTADELPVLGEVAEVPGFVTAVGSSGFTLGPTYGRLISELILTGRTSIDIDPYSPARFTRTNPIKGAH